LRMLKAKLRRRAKTPGLVRIRERSSERVNDFDTAGFGI
jgi:hypothetical protein